MKAPKLNISRANSSLIEVDQFLYAFGGINKNSQNPLLDTIERLHIPTMSNQNYWNLVEVKLPLPLTDILVLPISEQKHEFIIFGGWNKKEREEIYYCDINDSEISILPYNLQKPDIFQQNFVISEEDCIKIPGLHFIHMIDKEGISVLKYIEK